MRIIIPSILFFAVTLLAGCATSAETADEVQAAKDETRAMARETLAELESLQPGARRAVESAHAYAVFSNFGMKILLAGGGSGRGVAIRNAPREEVYMRMAEVQAGLGIGIKKFRLVWVLTTEEAYRNFVDKGWEFGAQATAQAQLDDQGGGHAGAVAVSPGVYLYQITDDGLALELTVKGTRYYRDSGLN
jgi:lipid-binding SYLF domain-containing protein